MATRENEPRSAEQPLASAALLKGVMAAHFADVDRAARERTAPVAWCTSVGPVELLRALGYQVFFPENHGAMLGASRMAGETMGRAHALGYSPDICSYLTSDVGAYLAGKSPLARHGLAGPPRPDVLVYNTNQCREVRDWFEFYGREWGVPVVGVTSFREVGEVEEHQVDAITRQLEALVAPLEAVAGRRLDAAALEQAVARSRTCSDRWRDCLRASAARPAPLTFFDATIHMGPAVVLRGTEEACRYYAALHAELEERVRSGRGALARERLRLYWDGMPIWGRLRDLATLFASLDTAVVASTYCNSWIFEALDPREPLRSMARASLQLFIARAEAPKQRYLERMARDFAVDGLVFHDSRTCPNNSNARFGMPQRLRAATRLPVLVLDGDLNDLRCFSDEQARTNIEAFAEQLEGAGARAASAGEP
ncbi:MAG TPA: 2-hydroxyacyl-CoA dehydratase family protein [Anaeromyxobacteraceae bacterium]|nr:2-hydroxyacyl-CoA dehydratase family protein [Anaeromyxobacteraceae bacterium]